METVNKMWGKEEIIENNKKYCLKFLLFTCRWMNSWHFHYEKDETFYVQEGIFYVRTLNNETLEAKEGLLYPGDSIRIKPKTFHRLCGLNYYNKIIEVSTSFKKNDVKRFEMGREVYGVEECELRKKERYLK